MESHVVNTSFELSPPSLWTFRDIANTDITAPRYTESMNVIHMSLFRSLLNIIASEGHAVDQIIISEKVNVKLVEDINHPIHFPHGNMKRSVQYEGILNSIHCTSVKGDSRSVSGVLHFETLRPVEVKFTRFGPMMKDISNTLHIRL